MEQGLANRLSKALGAVIIAVTIGTLGFWIISDDNASLGDCLYMTIITLSTVGYGEVIPMTGGARIFACLLIIFGMGSLIYFGSTVVAFWIELDMREARRRRKMDKAINHLKKHVIICGGGTTGSHVLREIIASRTPFVMIDNDEHRVRELEASLDLDHQKFLYIIGDATEDRILEEARLADAGGLVASLPNDKDNLYIILTARQINPSMRIVARATEKEAPQKMKRAGADSVVSPNFIGGLRIASEMLRPQVVEFLDVMLRDQSQATRIEQVTLPDNSPLIGCRLADTNIRQAADVLVIAIRASSGNYIYNPGPNTVLTARAVLVVLGSMDAIIKLRASVGNADSSITMIPLSPFTPG